MYLQNQQNQNQRIFCSYSRVYCSFQSAKMIQPKVQQTAESKRLGGKNCGNSSPTWRMIPVASMWPNCSGKVNRRGSNSSDQEANNRRSLVRDPARNPPTQPDSALNIIIVQLLYMFEKSQSKKSLNVIIETIITV